MDFIWNDSGVSLCAGSVLPGTGTAHRSLLFPLLLNSEAYQRAASEKQSSTNSEEAAGIKPASAFF